MLHAEVRILAVYAKYVAPPTKSVSKLATRKLELEQQPAFRWKIMTRQAFLKTVSTQSQQKFLWMFLHAASAVAYLQLWQQLHIMDGQCSYTADFVEP